MPHEDYCYALERENHALNEKYESLRQQLDGWIAANSPNGWIDNLRQQLADTNEHIEYMLSRDKAWADIESLKEQQLAASQKREVTLRKLIGEIYCSDDSSAEVTRKIEDVLSAMGNSYSKESTQGFEDWHSSHAKYMEPADIIHWCRDAYNAGVTSKCDVQLASLEQEVEQCCYGESLAFAAMRQQLTTLKAELKCIGEAIDDPRTDLTMTMSELILEYKQQLADSQKQATLLLCALEGATQIITFEGVPYYLLGIEERDEALAIQPDDSALKAWLGEPVMYLDKDGCTILPEDMEGNPRAHWQSLYAPKEMK